MSPSLTHAARLNPLGHCLSPHNPQPLKNIYLVVFQVLLSFVCLSHVFLSLSKVIVPLHIPSARHITLGVCKCSESDQCLNEAVDTGWGESRLPVVSTVYSWVIIY